MKLLTRYMRSVRGFTLIELTVSITIMIIMTGVLLANYPESAIRITLVNTVHKVALLVREAQVRGSAIDSSNSSLGGYGIYVDLATPGQIVLFGDSVTGTGGSESVYGLPIGDGLYETSPVNELKSLTTFPSRYVVQKVCVGQAFPFICNAYGVPSTPSITSLTISFTRPNPQPNIYINGSKATNYSAGCIELWSPHAPLIGHIRAIEVYNSGMIRTTLTGCDNN